MSEAGPSQYTWHNNTAKGNARVHNGPVHGNVTNNFYEDKKAPVARVLESLSFPEMNRYQQRPLETYPGTYEWIFDDSKVEHSCEDCAHTLHGRDFSDCLHGLKYQCRDAIMSDEKVLPEGEKLRSWLRTSQDILWISGKAGAGKSCFMKFLLENTRMAELLCEWTSHDVTIAGFFFWAAGGELEKSHIGLLRSLLYQVISKEPHLAERLFTSEHHTPGTTPSWSVSQLSKAFDMVLADGAVSTSFAFFIDGLDEFHGDVPDLLKALDNLNESPKIKICVSSREHSVFKNKYGRRDISLHMRLHEVTRQDVGGYIQGRLIDDLELQQSADPETGQQLHLLSNAIRDKAEGVFLWVYLAVKSLRESISNDWTISEMLGLLDDIPPELEDFIQRIFDSIHASHRRSAARTLFLMLSCSDRLELLSLALLDSWDRTASVNGGQSAQDSDVVKMVERAEQGARRWCKDLVNVHRSNDEEQWTSKNYIDFPHRTIRDFVWRKEQDGALADLAGSDFCPAFAMCSIYAQRPYYRRHFDRPEYNLSHNFEQFASFCDAVDPSKDMLLLNLAKDMDAFGQTIQPHDIHWVLEPQAGRVYQDLEFYIGPREVNTCSWDYRRSNFILAGLLLRFCAYRLFLLLVDTSHGVPRKHIIQSGLAAQLCWTEIVYHNPREACRTISDLLNRGADPSQMAHSVYGSSSAWMTLLTMFHEELGRLFLDFVPLIDEFLESGADPDVGLSPIFLYNYLEEPDTFKQISSLLPTPIQDIRALVPLCASRYDVHNVLEARDTETSSPKLWVPATTAFEAPCAKAGYLHPEDIEFYQKYFPIIKAKLVAASEAKARLRQIASDGRAVKRKRGNSSEAATRDRMSIDYLL